MPKVLRGTRALITGTVVGVLLGALVVGRLVGTKVGRDVGVVVGFALGTKVRVGTCDGSAVGAPSAETATYSPVVISPVESTGIKKNQKIDSNNSKKVWDFCT